MISTGKAVPEYGWNFSDDGTIRVQTKTAPKEVMLWSANNPDARDFRLETIGKAFQSTKLEPESNGEFVAPKASDVPGWTARFVELTYDVGGPFPLKVSTAVQITPDTYPYKDIELTKVLYEPEAAAERAQTGK
jgi:PhoPQ-activated pathogenicity-related protein